MTANGILVGNLGKIQLFHEKLFGYLKFLEKAEDL